MTAAPVAADVARFREQSWEWFMRPRPGGPGTMGKVGGRRKQERAKDGVSCDSDSVGPTPIGAAEDCTRRMHRALAEVRAEALQAADMGDPVAGQIERVVFAVHRAALRRHRSLAVLYRTATRALEDDGMQDVADEWPFESVEPAREVLKGVPGGSFAGWDDFERALLRHAQQVVREGAPPSYFAAWMKRAVMAAPRPWTVVRAVDLPAVIEKAMSAEHGWLDAQGHIVADTKRLVVLLTKIMRALGIDAKVRQTPFEAMKKAKRRKTSDAHKSPKTR